jgi:hypothetical protein
MMGLGCRFRAAPFVGIVDGSEFRSHDEGTHSMAQYLILIYEAEANYATASPEKFQEITEAHGKFGMDNEQVIAGGNALQSTGTATSIRSDGAGGFTVTDGPFAETKEALGGYYLIEADDLDGAIAVAKQCPAQFGGVEVRPIMVFS